MRYTLFLFVLLALLVGCVRLPSVKMDVPNKYLYSSNWNSDSLGYDVKWWHYFADTILNQLQERALSGNFDLAVAASKVEAARLNLKVARAKYLPELSLKGDATVAKSPLQGRYNNYDISAGVSWELPLFGALRSTKMASRAEIYSSEWAFRGVLLSLTAEVATTYFSLLEALESLNISMLTIESRRASAALIDSMSRHGMASGIDRRQAYSLLYSSQADSASYSAMVRESIISLQILFGEMPSLEDVECWQGRLLATKLTSDMSIGVPSQLLERRPDVMQAMFAADAAAARVGLARAARFPAVNLALGMGLLSNTIEGLTSGSPWNWSVAGSVVQPIFSFGALRGSENIAKESYYQALFLYEKSFVAAVAEVDEALLKIASVEDEMSSVERLTKSNIEISELTHALYRNGLSAYLDVLDAERSRYESSQQLVKLRAQQCQNYVALFKALGGGW